MKSFIRAITITIVLNLMLAASTTAQTVPAPAPTAPAAVPTAPAAVIQQVVSEADKTLPSLLSDLNGKLIQLNIATTGQYDGGRVLVIPTAEIMPQDMVTMMEDMTVMCRIFDKRLAESNLIPGRFTTGSRIRLSTPFSWDSRSTGAMYIQGYGTLFLIKVDFLLSPPSEVPEEKETEEEDTDPLWTQMRQEIYAPEEVGRVRRTGERPEEKYDAEKVEELKETLIQTLQHAANIRGLKPDESVILTVTGKASQSGQLDTRVYISGRSRYIATEPAGSGSGSLSPTVLTIRAKKADIDDFANGQLNFDQFTEKTQLLSYSYLGENVGEPSRSSSTDMYYGGRTGRSSRIRRR
ncbi:MAG TPA: hypothetical protein VMW72_23680 [Sedimentisphaerales bacterium]|nr:hypothetical protein [Sedimentisphaerales bacterium]